MKREVFLLGAAAAGAAARPAFAQQTPVRIASIPIDTGLEARFAERLGLFQKAGLPADVQTIANGAQITAGIAAGSLDIGFSNILTVAQAYERGIPLVAVFPGALFLADHPNGWMMVNRDSPIQSARDLNGKTIGIPGIGNMTQLGPMTWMDKNGGDPKSVKWLEIPFSALQAALDGRRIDAAFMTEPFYSAARAVDRNLANTLAAISPRFLTGVWFSTKAWATAHPDLVAKFVGAMRETARYANAHRADMVPWIAELTKVPEATVAAQAPIFYGEELSLKDVQPLLDASAKYGFIPRPLPASEILLNAVK